MFPVHVHMWPWRNALLTGRCACVPGTFPLKYRIPPLWLQGLFFFSGGFTVSLLWRESFFELPIRGLLYEMATTKPCQMIRQTWWIEAWFPQAFQENTAETDNFKAHDSAGFWSFLRCETYKWYYWRSSQGPSTKHDPQKGGIHHANLAPHKFAHIIWWLQISKTLASDFWGWTKLSINSTPSNKRWGSFQQVLRNLQVSTLSSISPRLRELYKMESSTIVAPSTAPIEIQR